MLQKAYQYSSIISIILIIFFFTNSVGATISTIRFAETQDAFGNDYDDGYYYPKWQRTLGVVILVGLLLLVARAIVRAIEPEPQVPVTPPPPTYKDERKFQRYETDKKVTTTFKPSVEYRAAKEGKYLFLLHLDKIEHVTTYRKEIWLEQTYKVYHDGKKELITQKKVIGDIIPVGKDRKVMAFPNAQFEVVTDTDLLKVGIVPKTDEYGNVQVALYSAKPFLEIEGTRSKNYGLTTKTQFLTEEKFRDYQIVPVEFRQQDAVVREEIGCYSLENSVKDFIDSAINTKITSVRFTVEDIDSHAPISNPSIKIDGMPPAEEELLAPYFTGEYNAYATQFVKDYLRGTHKATTYESVMLYYPFGYVIEVVHPKYHFWKKKVYIDGSKNEYIIRMSELGTKIRGEITTR